MGPSTAAPRPRPCKLRVLASAEHTVRDWQSALARTWATEHQDDWATLAVDGRALDKTIRRVRSRLAAARNRLAKALQEHNRNTATRLEADAKAVAGELDELKQQRADTPTHVRAGDLPEQDKLDALPVGGRLFLDVVRMIAYRAETRMLARLLGSIAAHLAPDSGVVFDYLLDGEVMSAGQRHVRQRLEAFVARRGEPMLGTYSRSEMSALAAAANLAEVEDTSLIDLQRRYQWEIGALPIEAPPFFALATYRTTGPAG